MYLLLYYTYNNKYCIYWSAQMYIKKRTKNDNESSKFPFN